MDKHGTAALSTTEISETFHGLFSMGIRPSHQMTYASIFLRKEKVGAVVSLRALVPPNPFRSFCILPALFREGVITRLFHGAQRSV